MKRCTCQMMLVVFVLFIVRMRAQIAGSASVSGTVRDPTAGYIPSARVVLTDIARQLERESSTNESGQFVFPNIPAGEYAIRVSKEGFESFHVTDIHLEVGQQAALDLELKIGTVTTAMDISAKQQMLLETESNTIGTVVDSTRVEELPLNGREVLQLGFHCENSRVMI